MTPTSSVEQRGFTLLELLVVLSIIALGVGLIAPNVGLTDNSAFSADVRKAAATLSYARRLAIVQARPVTAELHSLADAELAAAAAADRAAQEADAAALRAASNAAPDTAAQDAELQQRRWTSELVHLAIEDELHGAVQPVAVADLTFFPQGGSTGGTLHFTRNQRSAVIHISPLTGRIRVAWDGEELPDEG